MSGCCFNRTGTPFISAAVPDRKKEILLPIENSFFLHAKKKKPQSDVMIRRAINDLLEETTRVPILSEWPASENKIHADRNCPCGLCVVAFARAL